jgi:hypothetical protein
MPRIAKRVRPFWLVFLCLLPLLAACTSQASGHITRPAISPTPVRYSLAHGGICARLGVHPQPPYINIRVSHDAYLAHSEPMLVENPRNPLNLVGGTKFFSDPGHYRFQIGYFRSLDGGCTWQDGGVFPGFSRSETTSDITFAFGLHNDVYALVLNTSSTQGNGESGVSVLTSHDGGRSFGRPVSVFDDTSGKTFSDKPWIAVDHSAGPRSGTVSVVWSYDHRGFCGAGNFCSQELAFSRSTDGGRSFSPVRFVEGQAPFCSNPARQRPTGSTLCDGVLGATPVVLPDGSLAVVFLYMDVMSTGHIASRLVVVRSPDGGDHWNTPVLVAVVHDIPGLFRPERYRNSSLPAFACDPRTGQLYVTWADESSKDADILFATSTDHGQNWTALPIRVNDDLSADGVNQFQPQIAIAPDGVVSITFFDTRIDPRHRFIDVFLAQSTDHGASFLPNLRVTTQNWDPAVGAPVDGNGLQFIGDYQGLSADDTFVHPFWNDTRTGGQEIFTAAVPSVLPGQIQV